MTGSDTPQDPGSSFASPDPSWGVTSGQETGAAPTAIPSPVPGSPVGWVPAWGPGSATPAWGQPGWQMPPPGWQAPPPPPGTRARVHLIWLAALLVAALATGAIGYGVGNVVGRHAAQISAALKAAGAAGAATPHACPPVQIGTAQKLAAELLPVPAGDRGAKGRLAAKSLTIARYIRLLYGNRASNTASVLRGLCAQTAAHQEWVLPSGMIVSIWLVRFDDSADCRAYVLRTEQADLSDPKLRVHATLSGGASAAAVHDGLYIARPSLDKYGNTLAAGLADTWTTAVIVHIFRPARLAPKAQVSHVLTEQINTIVSSGD